MQMNHIRGKTGGMSFTNHKMEDQFPQTAQRAECVSRHKMEPSAFTSILGEEESEDKGKKDYINYQPGTAHWKSLSRAERVISDHV